MMICLRLERFDTYVRMLLLREGMDPVTRKEGGEEERGWFSSPEFRTRNVLYELLLLRRATKFGFLTHFLLL